MSLTFISFIVEGESGIAATVLSAVTAEDATTMNVASTAGFLSADFVFVGNETICYSGTTAVSFTGLTRGCRDTNASSHNSGTRVYNEATGVVNQVIGFNIAETMSTAGVIRTLMFVPGALLKAVPKLIAWDYSYLEGLLFGLPLVYIKYLFLYPISAGFLITFILAMINVFMGIARVFV